MGGILSGGDFVRGGLCPGGILSRGDFVRFPQQYMSLPQRISRVISRLHTQTHLLPKPIFLPQPISSTLLPPNHSSFYFYTKIHQNSLQNYSVKALIQFE